MSRAIFAMEALSDFRTVASVAPSSRYLVRAMLQPLPLQRARVVVELGCGTGVMTRALLKRLPSSATLLAFEINPRFTRYLKLMVSDPRLVLIDASAETIRGQLQRRGVEQVDAVVSSLGLAFMPAPQREAFLGELSGLLDEQGVFTQYHYLHGLQFQDGRLGRFDIAGLLRRHFRSVQRSIVWRNLPPAYVFICRQPLRSKANQGSRNGNISSLALP
jgi:phosphatidylethanolamine/phosphatidyl-N-methylethanolamine N-methyltransferase